MRVDFSVIQDIESFVSVPEGEHVCRIAEIREGATRDGSPRWSLRLEVADGDYAGRTAAWDALNWSERGLPRVKEILSRLGYDVSGTLDISPADLMDVWVRVRLMAEEREDPLSGRRISRLRVPFLGYEAADPEQVADREAGRSAGVEDREPIEDSIIPLG